MRYQNIKIENEEGKWQTKYLFFCYVIGFLKNILKFFSLLVHQPSSISELQ